MTTVEHKQLGIAELRGLLDELTRAELGLTVDEFLDRVRSQTLDMTSPVISRLAVIGRLLLEVEAARARLQ
jgi:hypothetical protein